MCDQMAPRFNTTFGVEIEFTTARHDTEISAALAAEGLRGWNLKGDGSIHTRHPRHGLELVSPILSGTDGIEQIKKACRVLANMGAATNESTGLHIHLGAQNLTMKQLRNFISFYTRFEGAIDQMMAPSRRSGRNQYCGTLSTLDRYSYTDDFYRYPRRAEDIAQRMKLVAAAQTHRDLVDLLPSRYYKVNTHALQKHGTIEVRHHQGTVNADKIIGWVKMLDLMLGLATMFQSPRPPKEITPEGDIRLFKDWMKHSEWGEIAFYDARVASLVAR